MKRFLVCLSVCTVLCLIVLGHRSEAVAQTTGGNTPVVSPHSSDFTVAAQEFAHAVVLIGSPKGGGGTGFVISGKERLVVTNAHVADLYDEDEELWVAINESPLGEPSLDGPTYRVKQVYYHPGVLRKNFRGKIVKGKDPGNGPVELPCPDIAILRLEGHESGKPLPCQVRLAPKGSHRSLMARHVATVGFPGHMLPKGEWPEGKTPIAIFQQGAVGRTLSFDDTPGWEWIQSTKYAWGGVSGSPLFTADAQVIGIVCAMCFSKEVVPTSQDESTTLTTQILSAIHVDHIWSCVEAHSDLRKCFGMK